MAGIAETAVFLQLQHLTVLESALNSQTLKKPSTRARQGAFAEGNVRQRPEGEMLSLFLRVHFQHVYAETCFVFVADDKSSGISSQNRSPDRAAQLPDLDYVARKGCSRPGVSHSSEDAAAVSGKGQQRSLCIFIRTCSHSVIIKNNL